MTQPNPRSFETECLRYKLARADLIEHYAACVQALADEHGVEITYSRGSSHYYVQFLVQAENGSCREPGGFLAAALGRLRAAGASADIPLTAIFDSDRRHFSPRSRTP